MGYENKNFITLYNLAPLQAMMSDCEVLLFKHTALDQCFICATHGLMCRKSACVGNTALYQAHPLLWTYLQYTRVNEHIVNVRAHATLL